MIGFHIDPNELLLVGKPRIDALLHDVEECVQRSDCSLVEAAMALAFASSVVLTFIDNRAEREALAAAICSAIANWTLNPQSTARH
jgi:metal-dependent HD superfamily phosphatase/phosphodiesterase